jgi:hypothetical protein
MSYFDFKSKLLNAQSSNATGKFQILGKLGVVSKGVSIDIYEGNVVKLRSGNTSGQTVAELLTAMYIDHVVYMDSSSIHPTPEENTPDTDTLLKMITDAGNAITNDRVKSIASDWIIETTIEAVGKFIGSSSSKLINGIAEEFPPKENEDIFLDKCREATTGLVGAKVANKIFDSLQEEES